MYEWDEVEPSDFDFFDGTLGFNESEVAYESAEMFDGNHVFMVYVDGRVEALGDSCERCIHLAYPEFEERGPYLVDPGVREKYVEDYIDQYEEMKYW